MLDLSASGSGTSALCLNTGSWSHTPPRCGKDIINIDILNAAPKFYLKLYIISNELYFQQYIWLNLHNGIFLSY